MSCQAEAEAETNGSARRAIPTLERCAPSRAKPHSLHTMNDLPLSPTREEFLALARTANLIPVSTELMADCETPVAAFQKLLDEDATGDDCAFLLESAESSDQIGRYSFLGIRPATVFESRGKTVTITGQDGSRREFETTSDPLRELETLLARYRPAPHASGKGAPFVGGAVGFLGYDAVRFFESTVPPAARDELDLPETLFLITDTLLTFDHRFRRLRVAANVFTEGRDPGAAYDEAHQRIARLVKRLRAPGRLQPGSVYEELPAAPEPSSNKTRAEFEGMVASGLEHIRAGDIFQFVPSQRFETPYQGDALSLYRALRFINPSPYMFLLRFGKRFSLVGSSPEVHVRALGGKVEIRPIAGTRPRGATPEEDEALAESLLADPKERAEHLMLVDLARNDVGRVSEFGTVRVTDFMTVERYSHVMHIVSNVIGKLRAGSSVFDVMRATFPAGTVSGSPKVRAMQIINELEGTKRGCYAGAVGYFGFDGNLDSCIALRSVVLKNGRAYVQAGAGVVADSSPAAEYEETCNKARGMFRAIELARRISQQ
jgi:anthranilate synthase component 1